ncbi:MAG TPA: acetylornithine deacetylase [Sphingobacteriaceae bacterium]|nr:acetylornithine deacetylase [Sphingobacteriaceae bacterium]
MASNFFKITIRNIRKNATYSFLNILGLAIGITCAALIFLWTENEMTYDNFNVKKDRLYSVQINKSFDGTMHTMGSTPRPMGASLKAEIPGIVNAARISDRDERLLFSFGNKSLYAMGRYADASLFSMFTLPFVEGNATSAFAKLYSIVITEKAAKRFFGEEKNLIGKTVRIDNSQDFVISGILKDLPENSTLQFEWLAPYQVVSAQVQARTGDNSDEFNWGSYGPFTYVELAPNVNVTAINKQLQDYIHSKNADQESASFLFPMSDWHLYREFENGKQTGGGQIKQVRLLSAIAWIILLIACINFMNLATANSQKRSREVGVRKVLGAGKRGLISQFMGEALFMSFLATIVAVIIMAVSLPAFNMLMQKQLSLHLGSPFHLISLLCITLICGLVAGSYPSLYLSSFRPVLVLKGLKLKTGNAAFIRKGLVVLQFTVSVVFIISTIIVYMQIRYVKNRNLGFNKDNLLEIDMQHDISKTFSPIKQDLLQTGIVQNVAMSDHVTLFGGNTDSRFEWQGKASDNEVSIAFRNVSPEFVSTSGMKIIEGQDFSENAGLANSSVIITQTFEKLMGEGTAVGKTIRSPRGNPEGVFSDMTVVGVVSDYVYGNMYGHSGPVLFFCKTGTDANLMYVRIKPQQNTEEALAKIEAVIKNNNPDYPFEYKFVDDQFNKMFFNEMLISKISGVFAVLAIIISCLGLFGLAAYTAEQRVKEIGIRKVLGASVSGLAGLLSKDFIQLVVISCLVAFPVSWWIMHDWLQSYEYRIVISWWVFLIAGAVAILIALFTVSFQAIKAAVANPIKSLRAE